jgi:hypothetical protein
MRNLLTVISGSIEVGDLQLCREAIRRIDAALSICGKCPMGTECPLETRLDADLFERLPRAKAV